MSSVRNHNGKGCGPRLPSGQSWASRLVKGFVWVFLTWNHCSSLTLQNCHFESRARARHGRAEEGRGLEGRRALSRGADGWASSVVLTGYGNNCLKVGKLSLLYPFWGVSAGCVCVSVGGGRKKGRQWRGVEKERENMEWDAGKDLFLPGERSFTFCSKVFRLRGTSQLGVLMPS